MNVDNINVRRIATVEELDPYSMGVPVLVIGNRGFFNEWQPTNLIDE